MNSVLVVSKLDTEAAITAISASLKHCLSTMYLADKSLEDAGNYNLEIISVSKVTLSTS